MTPLGETIKHFLRPPSTPRVPSAPSPTNPLLSRRQVLRWGAAAVGAGVLTACGVPGARQPEAVAAPLSAPAEAAAGDPSAAGSIYESPVGAPEAGDIEQFLTPDPKFFIDRQALLPSIRPDFAPTTKPSATFDARRVVASRDVDLQFVLRDGPTAFDAPPFGGDPAPIAGFISGRRADAHIVSTTQTDPKTKLKTVGVDVFLTSPDKKMMWARRSDTSLTQAQLVKSADGKSNTVQLSTLNYVVDQKTRKGEWKTATTETAGALALKTTDSKGAILYEAQAGVESAHGVGSISIDKFTITPTDTKKPETWSTHLDPATYASLANIMVSGLVINTLGPNPDLTKYDTAHAEFMRKALAGESIDVTMGVPFDGETRKLQTEKQTLKPTKGKGVNMQLVDIARVRKGEFGPGVKAVDYSGSNSPYGMMALGIDTKGTLIVGINTVSMELGMAENRPYDVYADGTVPGGGVMMPLTENLMISQLSLAVFGSLKPEFTGTKSDGGMTFGDQKTGIVVIQQYTNGAKTPSPNTLAGVLVGKAPIDSLYSKELYPLASDPKLELKKPLIRFSQN